MKHSHRLFGLVMMAMLMLAPQISYAQVSTDAVCTQFKTRSADVTSNDKPTTPILTDVYTFIHDTVGSATQTLFQSFLDSSAYQLAVTAAITLMVIFYGVGFLIGIVQPSFQQVLIRLVKIGVIFWLISPTGGWTFFSETMVYFFQNGTDQLVSGVQQIGMGGTPPPAGSGPFYQLDKIAGFLINPDTLIAIMGAVMAGGPFGLTMGGLLILAMYGFFQLMLHALQNYAVSFVARSLILGVAPIFFIFLLFDRTKGLFVAWLNALINLSLQPILLFTFLSFFLVMIQSAETNMLGVELCWNEFKNVEGSVNKTAFWRFVDPTTNKATTGDLQWNGSLECLLQVGSGGTNTCPAFPINIVDLLSFLILVYLANRFTEVVERISSELSNALVSLDSGGKLDNMLQSANQKGSGLLSKLDTKQGGTR